MAHVVHREALPLVLQDQGLLCPDPCTDPLTPGPAAGGFFCSGVSAGSPT